MCGLDFKQSGQNTWRSLKNKEFSDRVCQLLNKTPDFERESTRLCKKCFRHIEALNKRSPLTYEDKYDIRDKNLLVLYLQTVVITAGPGVTMYLMQVNNILTVNFIFCSLKANTWRFKNIACNRNEPKQCIHMANYRGTQRHADYSGNHVDL